MPIAGLVLALAAGPAHFATGGGARGGAEGEHSDPAAAVRAILAAEPAGKRRSDEPAARIAALGPDAAAGIFAVLCERDELGTSALEIVHAAAAKLGRPAFVPLFTACRADEATPARGRAALDLLATLGIGRDLELVPALAGPAPSWTPEVGEAFRGAFAAILARDEEALRGLDPLLALLSDSARGAAIREVGRHAAPASLAWLGDHLTPGLELPVLSAIERLPGPILLGAADATRERVRDLLQGEDGQTQRKAAIVAGALGDFEAADRLIELLASDELPAREGARAALVTLTGLNLPAQPERWRAWLDEERAWYDAAFPRRAADLESGVTARVLQALQEIGDHRYERHRLAQTVLRALERREPGVRDLAIRTLERLGSASATPDLVRLLGDPEPGIAEHAWQALRAITGRDLPLDAEAWQAVP